MIGTCGFFVKYAETYSVKGFEKSFFEGFNTGQSFDFPTMVTAGTSTASTWSKHQVTTVLFARSGSTALLQRCPAQCSEKQRACAVQKLRRAPCTVREIIHAIT